MGIILGLRTRIEYGILMFMCANSHERQYVVLQPLVSYGSQNTVSSWHSSSDAWQDLTRLQKGLENFLSQVLVEGLAQSSKTVLACLFGSLSTTSFPFCLQTPLQQVLCQQRLPRCLLQLPVARPVLQLCSLQ